MRVIMQNPADWLSAGQQREGREWILLGNQGSSGQKLNVVVRGKEFCLQLRWVFVESCSQKFTVYAKVLSMEGALSGTVSTRFKVLVLSIP